MKTNKTQGQFFGEQHPASFRDPSGFVFCHSNQIYRQINKSYRSHYDLLMKSGLYEALVADSLIIPHLQVPINPITPSTAYCVIQPQKVPFISYPYEWSFSQLKDAGLFTLKIMQKALEYGMWLKDASAYNIQFLKGKPVLIDTLSLERYPENSPWIAYRQFCQHFLAPLALMSYSDIHLSQLLKTYLDGLPLGIVSHLLPWRSWLSVSLISHLHLQAKIQNKCQHKANSHKKYQLKLSGLKALLENLQRTLESLHWKRVGSDWTEYYSSGTYSSIALEHKKFIVAEWIHRVTPRMVWDLGANVGVFSQIACYKEIFTIPIDSDPAVIEEIYTKVVKKGEDNILPLLVDLTNPSPAVGWDNTEHYSLVERGPADLLLFLGLIHHFAISHNITLLQMAKFFSKIGKCLIVEFIPLGDLKAQLLLKQRELSQRGLILEFYQLAEFERIFSQYFYIRDSVKINDSERIMYLMFAK